MRNAPKTFLIFAAVMVNTAKGMAMAPEPPPPSPPPPVGLPVDGNLIFLLIAAIGLASYKFYKIRKQKITRA